MPLLDVDALSVRFETDDGIVQAVDDLSFDLEEREVLGIVGESGCGKSVSLMSLLGLLPSTAKVEGTAFFDGTDLLSASSKQIGKVRGRQIAFVFQEPMTSLNPSFRVGRQVAEVLERHLDLSRRAADRRAVELLDLVRIPAPDKRVREYPHQLSGGMRQRVMIAMALACDPKVLVADEPTTALDVTIQAGILDLMRDIRERLGTAIVLITHNLGVVADIADRVLVMYAGRKVEEAARRDPTPGRRRPQRPTAGDSRTRAVARRAVGRVRLRGPLPARRRTNPLGGAAAARGRAGSPRRLLPSWFP